MTIAITDPTDPTDTEIIRIAKQTCNATEGSVTEHYDGSYEWGTVGIRSGDWLLLSTREPGGDWELVGRRRTRRELLTLAKRGPADVGLSAIGVSGN